MNAHFQYIFLASAKALKHPQNRLCKRLSGYFSIFACTTFAWFTSKDEVTNRLSANADYGVSIVESFAPPANWIPGQNVNKDVYAVNTGSIPAFVKEEVSGVMTYTIEKKTNTLTNDSIKLTAAERYVVEAGAYLAGAFDSNSNAIAGVELGKEVIDMVPNGTNLDAYVANTINPPTDFTPTADGLYVFRRTIETDANAQTELFTYDGYYYKGGEFYKISNLTVTPDTENDLAGNAAASDGNVSAAAAGFWEEETRTVVPTLTYDATRNYLVATVSSSSTPANYTDLATAAAAYDKALEDYQLALAAFQAATDENATQDGDVATKKADMDAKYVALQNAIAAEQAALDAKNAADALVADLTAQQTALTTEVTTKEGAKNTAQDALTNANNDLSNADPSVVTQFGADVQAKLGHTVAQATYAELNGLFGTDYAHYSYYQKVVAQKRAQEEYDIALAAYNAAVTKKGQVDAALLQAEADASTANANYATAQGDKNTAQNNYGIAVNDYDTAVYAAGDGTTGTSGNLAAAKTKLSNAAQTLANAEKTYNELNESVSKVTDIVINIKLSDAVTTAGGVADKWQLNPSATLTNNTAEFYYTGILEGGETSSKLIDSVELDSSVTKDMYKFFDFDLNVALKSAQITYGNDNETILATAATEELGKTPTLANAKDLGTALTWPTT